MTPIGILTLFFLLVASCHCSHKLLNRQKFHNVYQECIKETGYVEDEGLLVELEEDFSDESEEDGYPWPRVQPDDLSKGNLCLRKCIDEKYGELKDGKFDIAAIRNDVNRMQSLKTPEQYLKCLEKIYFKDCEDYKKKIECDNDVGDTHKRQCIIEWKYKTKTMLVALKDVEEIKDRHYLCYEKCLLESKGIIDKNGKVVLQKLEEYGYLAVEEDKNKLFACLKDLVIKECEDLLKLDDCMPL